MSSKIKKRNKSLNKYLGSQEKKKKLIENTLKTNYNSNKEYDNFQITISSIAKQLNNISLKSFSHTKLSTNKIGEPKKNINNCPPPFSNPVKSLKIFNNNSFFIKGTNVNMNIIKEKNEIKKENENLKENIKFLLGQIKRYQKGGITIEEEAKEDINEINNELKIIITLKEKEIDKLNNEIKLDKKRMIFLEEEYNNLKEKYNELKAKYKNDLDNLDNINIPDVSSAMDENQLYQYNSKKNNYNTYYLNYENSKNNAENNNYNNKKYAFHKSRHTTDFSHNYFLRNNDSKKLMKDFENTNLSIKTNDDTSATPQNAAHTMIAGVTASERLISQLNIHERSLTFYNI